MRKEERKIKEMETSFSTQLYFKKQPHNEDSSFFLCGFPQLSFSLLGTGTKKDKLITADLLRDAIDLFFFVDTP